MTKQIGIYVITSPTNKIYVGQSGNIQVRIQKYSGLNCKSQRKLYNSIKKHGWDAHKFEVILPMHHSTTQKWLDFWEQYWMDHYRAEGYELLNLKEGGNRGKMAPETKQRIREVLIGRTVSKKTRDKLSKIAKSRFLKGELTMLGNPHSEKTKTKIGLSNAKTVLQFDNTTLIKEWCSAAEAARQLTINNISRSCITGIKAGGFTWKYK